MGLTFFYIKKTLLVPLRYLQIDKDIYILKFYIFEVIISILHLRSVISIVITILIIYNNVNNYLYTLLIDHNSVDYQDWTHRQQDKG